MYKYGPLKPVKVIFKRGGRRGKIMEGMKQTWVQYMFIWKCHNETPLYNYHILIKIFFKTPKKTTKEAIIRKAGLPLTHSTNPQGLLTVNTMGTQCFSALH
jgi:hypothetical protein